MPDFHGYHVAYFSMEIGIDHHLPTYSGGLGVLAGDTLRSACDLGLPNIGVTLIYKKGYFHQRLSSAGDQQEEDWRWNPTDFLEKLPVDVVVKLDGRDVHIQAWKYLIQGIEGHKNAIIFLDTDLDSNSEYDRTLTDHLYGGDRYYRLCQEIVLGIGGVKILHALGCDKLEKYHMNEGHSALLSLALIEEGMSIEEVRDHCVFTTHTPVPAGHDQFERDMAERMLAHYIKDDFREEIFHDGKLNMTHVGLRFSTFINGVAKKHGEVSRSMFPNYHIESITNGVHALYWTCDSLKELFDEFIPGWRVDPFNLRYVLSIPKERIWNAHFEAKKKLMDSINKKYNAGMDPNLFTIGFARRAATYKRGDMLFSDPERLKRIARKFRGLQIVYAGKAHPNDGAGKDVIKRIFSGMDAVRDSIKVCYIENYDIDVAKTMIAGVDVWLNTPLRPREASGTSGMKAAMNGVPHFSVLDGWWLEGHIEKVTGWSIGIHPDLAPDGGDQGDDVRDLYEKLEYVIMPRFYTERDRWLDIMRHSIAINGSFFNTHRMVQQYVANAYFK